MIHASPVIQAYLDAIDSEVERCYAISRQARSLGYDPDIDVDIKLARNMAERVEGLISAVAPFLAGKGVPARIIELEKEYAPLDWRVALRIALEVAQGKFCSFSSKLEGMEVGIRTGFAYQTAGIVAAPLEGFIELRIKKTRDGKEYFAPTYAGPIRGAGGTAAAFSLLITDYVRTHMGYAPYDPTDEEVSRYKTEVLDYHERVTNLQYLPSEDELDFLVRHLPIQIDGEPTEERDVSNHLDLDRIETNRIRGGVCLVLAEGLAQKSPKIWKRVAAWGSEMGLNWGFLDEFLKLQKQIKAKRAVSSETKKEKITPNFTFISDLVAGRPVFSYPMSVGGFRLRYGRSRFSGFSAAGMHPATFVILDNFIATGTQLKVERPGKAAAITPCDSIDGPTVLLDDGSVVCVNTLAEAKALRSRVVKILFLGDILFNYGDFSENGHIFAPCGYNPEWWAADLSFALAERSERSIPASELHLSEELLTTLAQEPFTVHPDFATARAISEHLKIPLHPHYLFFWKLLSFDDLTLLISSFSNAKFVRELDVLEKIIFPMHAPLKALFEKIGIPHLSPASEFIVIEKHVASALVFTLQLSSQDDVPLLLERINYQKEKDILSLLSILSSVPIKDKCGTFIGARMGRPEKAKMRKLNGSPHVLFPVGEEGGRLRCFQSALEAGKVTADFCLYYCPACQRDEVYRSCTTCHEKTIQRYSCRECGILNGPECRHGPAHTYARRSVDIQSFFAHARKHLPNNHIPDLIKGVRGTSNKDHVPEFLLKGILRAKHEVYVNKDGTIRFDMSEIPITHFKPVEIGVSIAKLHELGYTLDCFGSELTDENQVVEIKPQDVVIPAAIGAMDEQSDKVMVRAAAFIDDLLEYCYALPRYYHVKKREDLIGHLVLGLAPHISAGMVGRIVGFSNTQGFLAHPLFHAALRRDCDGDEASISLLLDATLNFSRRYLPNRRGASTMDAPLVLTCSLNPSEVDDQALGLDVVWKYPKAMYEAAELYKNPWEIPIEQLNKRVHTPLQYEQMGYTHPVSSINVANPCSAYKSLPSMDDKLQGQMRLAVKICAVNEADVAKLVIDKHFLKDLKGNLRKFSQQSFRCSGCNEIFRRPPLIGKCTVCGGRLIFTISEGSVTKYLQASVDLATNYNVPPYLKQTIMILQKRVEEVFGKDKEKQEALGKWF